MSAKDPLLAAVAAGLAEAQQKALANVNQVLADGTEEGDAKWADSSSRTRVSLALVQASLAAERAKDTGNRPQALGVIVLERRLSDTPENRNDWEAEARRLADSRAIEAVTVPKKEPDAA